MPTKPVATQRYLVLAFSPGVAEPCRRIAEHPDAVFRYTARWNRVAVVSTEQRCWAWATWVRSGQAGDGRQGDPVQAAVILAGFPFSALRRPANVLIFPGLDSANIELLWRLGGVAAIGPILLGMARPVHVLQRGSQAAENREPRRDRGRRRARSRPRGRMTALHGTTGRRCPAGGSPAGVPVPRATATGP